MADRRDRLERVGNLVAYLLDRAGPASREDIERVIPEYEGDSGRRRFEDDKATLRKAGIDIRTVEHYGETGYELRRRDYELPKLDLTDEEQAALSLAISSVDFEKVVWSRLAGLKLGADGPSPLGVIAALPGTELLPRLDEAVVEHRRIRFRYKREDREVEPWGLVLKHGRWYVPGWDRGRDARRTFRVDRIDPGSLVVDDQHDAFEVPAGIEPIDLVPDDALSIGGGDAVTARLRVDRRIAPLVAPGTPPDGGTEDEVVVEVQVAYRDGFVPWVLSFGELVVVEEPAELRRAVIERLQELTA